MVKCKAESSAKHEDGNSRVSEEERLHVCLIFAICIAFLDSNSSDGEFKINKELSDCSLLKAS